LNHRLKHIHRTPIVILKRSEAELKDP
jgi:hypothetical protein